MLSDQTPSEGDLYEEFLELFLQHRDRLFTHVFSLVPHEADAEDVFQRCSIVLWKKFAEFDRSASFPAWAFGIAANEVRNFLKTRRRSQSRLAFFPEPIEQLTRERLRDEEEFTFRKGALQDCIDRLRPAERNLLRIAYWETQTVKEFAEATNGSLQALYNRLGKIRRALLDCIERKVAGEFRHG